ncbi:hypothetical protein G7046_g2215 [Stylonectria norvegica]|nr:hypothetical protein G7046_g2215 [Stylonectria norvegica]
MTSSSNWKTSLSASERYDTIQALQEALGTDTVTDAFAVESAAYQNSSTREEYETACQAAVPVAPTPTWNRSDDSIGRTIGDYEDCHSIGEGATSKVYRSGDKALKVIVSYHNMEPHNPRRECNILQSQRPPCIPLIESFRDQDFQFVLVFPLMPYTLADLLEKGPITAAQVRSITKDILRALRDIHAQGIIHRDIKPSAILLASPSGPAFLSDFGIAWHPEFSAANEPPNGKVLDIGSGPYRAPEVLFGDKSYGPGIDMWGFGVLLTEALRSPPEAIFESRPVREDGSQLGLILSIFKTIGTPTEETWPAAKDFKISPFELWKIFPKRPWEEILPDVDVGFRKLVADLVRYDADRVTASQALKYKCFVGRRGRTS